MFEQNCYIRKNTPELRAYLENIGYQSLCTEEYENGVYLLALTNGIYTTLKSMPSGECVVDCGDNDLVFRYISALRKDTDKNQWFVRNTPENDGNDWIFVEHTEVVSRATFHKATVDELIERFVNTPKMSLGDRMKEYEHKSRVYLERKQPVILRIDGKAFHTYTRGFVKPFDVRITDAMKETMLYLCKNIQGCIFGYTQSDEITLVLIDYQNEKTDAWFGYNLAKTCSIASSMATMVFNKYMWNKGTEKDAMFDARAFSLPIDEVNNSLIWRQRDAIRNSVQSCAHARFSHKEILKLNTTQMQEKMINEAGFDWNTLPIGLQRGFGCIKNETQWTIDDTLPLFSENRDYVDNLVYVGEYSKN